MGLWHNFKRTFFYSVAFLITMPVVHVTEVEFAKCAYCCSTSIEQFYRRPHILHYCHTTPGRIEAAERAERAAAGPCWSQWARGFCCCQAVNKVLQTFPLSSRILDCTTPIPEDLSPNQMRCIFFRSSQAFQAFWQFRCETKLFFQCQRVSTQRNQRFKS